MSTWFSQKLNRAFNATAAGAAGTKRTRLDCSSTIASGEEGGKNKCPSSDVNQQELSAAKVSTDHFAELETMHAEQHIANHNRHNQRFHEEIRQMPPSDRNRFDPRDTKRRCFHNDANHQLMGYSDSALPRYHPHGTSYGPPPSHADAYGRGQGFFSSWPSSEYHPHPHQQAYSSEPMMMEPAYHGHPAPSYSAHPPSSGYHRHSYYGNQHPPPPLPPTAPSSTVSKPRPILLAKSAKGRLLFQRRSSAFSSLEDLDPDDAEVQGHNMSSPPPPKPKAMPSPHYAHNPVGGHWYPHQPPSGYPRYPPQMTEGHYHQPITSPAWSQTRRNLSCYSSPRSTFGASAMWSTMKVGQHVRPSNPMATLFNYVGEEHKHMRGAPSNEEYYVVTNHPRDEDDASEITLDTIFDRHDPTARYIDTCIDEYPEFREPRASAGRGSGSGESRIPLTIDIATVNEDEPLEACRRAPRRESIHRISNNGESIKPSPKNGKIQRIVSCDEYRHSPMIM